MYIDKTLKQIMKDKEWGEQTCNGLRLVLALEYVYEQKLDI